MRKMQNSRLKVNFAFVLNCQYIGFEIQKNKINAINISEQNFEL